MTDADIPATAGGEAGGGAVVSPAPGPLLGWLTLLALLNGLLWAVVVPPWQAPDEPKHFEYVRLMAEGRALPEFASDNTAVDPQLQRAILTSMEEHGFWWFGRAPSYAATQPAADDAAGSDGTDGTGEAEGPNGAVGAGGTAGADDAVAADRELPASFADVWPLGSHTAVYRSSPVYYRAAALLQPADLLAGLYAARALSVMIGALIVFLTGLAARELFPTDPFVRYGAPALLACLPMFAFIHAGVNNDVLVNLLAALSFLLMARLWTRGASVARVVLLLGVVALAIAVKRIAVVLVPTTLVALITWAAGHWAARTARLDAHAMEDAAAGEAATGAAIGAPDRASAGTAAAAEAGAPAASADPASGRDRGSMVTVIAAVAVLLVVIGSAAWFLTGGWESLPDSLRWRLTQYFFNEPDQAARIAAYIRAPGAVHVMAEYAWQVHNTFWGSFGWSLIDLPQWLYALLAAVGLVALAGLARRLLASETNGAQASALVTYTTAIAVTAAAAIAFFMAYLDLPFPVPPQGRYMFVTALPIAVVFTAGIGAWVTPPWRPRALVGFVCVAALFDVAVLLGLVVPYFYA